MPECPRDGSHKTKARQKAIEVAVYL